MFNPMNFHRGLPLDRLQPRRGLRESPLRRKRQLRLEDTLSQQWTLTPEGTSPYAHMKSAFAAAGVPFPAFAVQMRSVTLIKSLVARSGFVTWMSEPMYDMEKTVGILDREKIDGLEAP